MSKRILSLVLALVMVLGTFGTVFAADTAQKDAAEFLAEAKVLLGDDKGNLNLDLKLERRDMVVLLSRLMGDEEVASEFPTSEESPTWEDARTDAYYVPFFAWAQVNKFFAGNSEKEFAPREAITAQDYAVVLLRALGYDVEGHDAWKAALADAKALGILADVVVEDATEITRGQMSVMTLNALAVNVKDSTKTLAETLEIVLPTPAVLEVEEVVADNLKEVKVSFNKDVDVDLTDIELFSIKGLTITDASVEDDELVLSVSQMTNKKAYELVIKGTEEVDGKFEFTVLDNAIPEVVAVEALGTKALKVTMSEPVKDVATKNFKLDGKSYFGAINVTGREIILTPYGKVLTVGEHKLNVASLTDFAGFKSLEAELEFEVIEDKVAPEVVSVTGTLERLVVTFSEDVDHTTVTKNSLYWNAKANTGTPVKLAGNKYAFEFAKSLPLYEVTLNIQGVKDYSGNTMKAVEVAYKGELDIVRPEVVEAAIKADSDAKVIKVKFTKSVEKESAEKAANYTLTDKDGKVIRVANARLVANNNKEVEVNLYNSLKNGESYTLKVEGVRDTTKLLNTMLPFEGKLTVAGAAVKTEVSSVAGNKDKRTIHVSFSKEMDMTSIANLDNYIINVAGSSKVLSSIEDAGLEVVESGKAVIIELPKEIGKVTVAIGTNVKQITVIGVRDTDGNLILNHGTVHNIVIDGTKIKEATANSTTEVVVEFDQAITYAAETAFEIVKLNGDATSVKVTDVSVNGTKKVTLTVEKLPVDAYNYKVEVVNGKKIETILENNAEEIASVLIDKIAPSLDKLVPVLNEAAFILEFDEDLDFAAVELFAQDIEVVRYSEGPKFLVRGRDFETAEKASNKILVTIVNPEILEVGSEYGVTIDNPKYIVDASTKKNTVEKSDEFNFTLKAVEVEPVETDAEKAAAVDAMIIALPKVAEIVEADRDAIEAARAAYVALTDAQKALVEHEDWLVLKEAALAAL